METKSYRPHQAADFLGVGVATFWRWAKERPDFPPLIRLSARCTVIDGDQLLAWRNAQARPLKADPLATNEAQADPMAAAIKKIVNLPDTCRDGVKRGTVATA